MKYEPTLIILFFILFLIFLNKYNTCSKNSNSSSNSELLTLIPFRVVLTDTLNVSYTVQVADIFNTMLSVTLEGQTLIFPSKAEILTYVSNNIANIDPNGYTILINYIATGSNSLQIDNNDINYDGRTTGIFPNSYIILNIKVNDINVEMTEIGSGDYV